MKANIDVPASFGIEKIRERWQEVDSMAGVGIDPVIERIPSEIWEEVGSEGDTSDAIFLFNKRIIDATAEHVVDFKVNSNFFQGELGRKALASTFEYLKEEHPDAIRICDGKFADVGHTAEEIAEEIFGNLDADAVLLNPYMGFDAIEPFAKWKDKLVVLCVNTSNPSAKEVQDLPLENGKQLWRHILSTSLAEWNENGNIIPVLSATHPENLANIRDDIGDTPIVLAGVGSQGGDLDSTVQQTLDSAGFGLLISASRAILYPEREGGESLDDASRRAVLGLKNAINQAKGNNSE